ncbi:MAG: polysaccharide biosynthesis/export family protein, partial [bacterium]
MVYVQDDSKHKDLGKEFVNEQDRSLIQKFDEIYVAVSSFSEDDPGLINANESRIGGRTSTDYSLVSYQVDENGNITLPLIGETPVTGKTVDQVAGEIEEELEGYFYSPSVKVSFVNKNITVIGMVEN